MTERTDKKIIIKGDLLTCERLHAYAIQNVQMPGMLIHTFLENKEKRKLSLTFPNGRIQNFDLPVRLGSVLDALSSDFKNKAHEQKISFGKHELLITEGIFHNAETGKSIRLTEKEIEILVFLQKHQGSLVSRKELLTTIWNYAETVETHTLETHIYRLRQKIESDPAKPEILITEENGYRIKA